jgi:hypothetical protein
VRKYFIEGDVHWNAMGHAFVAEKTVDFIKKEGHK